MIDGRIRMDLNWTVQFYISTTKIPLCVNLPEDGCLNLKHNTIKKFVNCKYMLLELCNSIFNVQITSTVFMLF